MLLAVIPVAHSTEPVEHQPGGAAILCGDAVEAGIEQVAYGGIGVRVETVESGTYLCGSLGRL